MKQILLACLMVLSLYVQRVDAEEILIYIRDDVYEDYVSFLDGRDVLSIDTFSGKTVRRDVVDMILAQQALKLGGFVHSFKYAAGKLNFRNTRMLQQGRLLISFDSYWLADAKALNGDVLISSAVIRKGEYVAGIYTHPKNKNVLGISSLNDLQKLTAVSTPKWRTDWSTLQSLGLKSVVREDEWLSMARMVHLRWVDFLLMPFHSTPDKSFTLEKMTFIPVPDIGVKLEDSRHFVISAKHPYGKSAFEAMEKGLSILRKENKIVTAYKQAGFFVDENKIKIINK